MIMECISTQSFCDRRDGKEEYIEQNMGWHWEFLTPSNDGACKNQRDAVEGIHSFGGNFANEFSAVR